MVDSSNPICYQRQIRDKHFLHEHCALQGYDLRDCHVEAVGYRAASDLILKYEYLGSMPTGSQAQYGLFRPDGFLIGVACFANGASPQAGNFCGAENSWRIKCLARGACLPISSRNEHADNGASYLISRACRLAFKEHGWGAFFAYADQHAGEIGTVYQACNWLYLGQGHSRSGGRMDYFSPSKERHTSRRMRAMLRRSGFSGDLKEWFQTEGAISGWTRERFMDKHKYVLILDKKLRLDKTRFVPQPYPKRESAKSSGVGAEVRDWRIHTWSGYKEIRREHGLDEREKRRKT